MTASNKINLLVREDGTAELLIGLFHPVRTVLSNKLHLQSAEFVYVLSLYLNYLNFLTIGQ